MLTLNFGLEECIVLSITYTWLLLLLAVICVIVLHVYKKRCARCFQYVAVHFNTVWYFFVMIVLTVFTAYHFEAIDYKELSFATITATALLILLFLPFFKRIVAFGVEAEIISILEKEAALSQQEKIMKIGTNTTEQNHDRLDLLEKFQSLKKEIKVD